MTHTQAIGSRAQVMNGTAHHTTGGLVKKDLKRNPKTGEIVSKAKAKDEKKNPWIVAVGKARKELIKEGRLEKGEFHPVTGVLLTRARQIYK